jgi:hypothetical protein
VSSVLQHPVNSIMPTSKGTIALTAMTGAGALSGALGCLLAALSLSSTVLALELVAKGEEEDSNSDEGVSRVSKGRSGSVRS